MARTKEQIKAEVEKQLSECRDTCDYLNNFDIFGSEENLESYIEENSRRSEQAKKDIVDDIQKGNPVPYIDCEEGIVGFLKNAGAVK